MTIITTNKSKLSSGNISSQVSNMSYAYPMQPAAEYRKVQQKSDGETLLITIPNTFARAIIPPLKKADTVKMTLEDNKRIVVQRTAD
ncbi:MAG: hypothetical protein WA941_08475 [Nitrososphaeraceae archaeon]